MDPKKTALLIVDMQNDVMTRLVKTASTVISPIKEVLDTFRKKEAPILFLKRVHRVTGVDVESFRVDAFKEKPFLVAGTQGAEVVKELTPLEHEYSVVKERFSGFFQTDLLMILMRLGVTTVVVCGVQTPNCIRATVMDALAYDYRTILLLDATAAQTTEVHQANLFDMKNMGAEIKTVSAFLDDF